MAFTNVETKIPKLLLDYLEIRRVELELPDAEALPFFEQLRQAERTMPCVVVYVSDFVLPHPKLFRCVVQVDLMANTNDTSEADETAWAASLRHAAADTAAFLEHLAGLTEEQRTGWQITKYRPSDGGLILQDGIRTRRTTVAIHCRANETTV